jgi:DNA-binding NarL/FixJ family response regulator
LDGDFLARPSIRVLVVDDFEPFRRFTCSVLQNRPDIEVICEASDGLEAVQKAQELQPDLILLDLNLPNLNGIEVARQIRECSPKSKVLFVSENRSPDIAEEALRNGASGYVVKSDAGSELLPAVDAVLHGGRFVSARLGGPNFRDPLDKHAVNDQRRQEITRRHEVEFYRDDAALVAGFARSVETALKIGNAAIVIATDKHRANLFHKLRADGVNVDVAIEQGSYIPLDAADTLSMIMVNDLPDPVLCAKAVGDLLTGAAKGSKGEHPRVAICGECAPTLLAEGNVEAAVRFERLWDEITKSYDADTLCGYLRTAFRHKESDSIFKRICTEHEFVRGNWWPQAEPPSFD